jgi:hypothetical protein
MPKNVVQKQNKITVPDAIINLAQRLKYLEEVAFPQLKAIELKIGDMDTNLTENAPDMDLIANMFKVQTAKIDALSERIAELEKKADIKPPRKKGTVKLTELDVSEEPGISFS